MKSLIVTILGLPLLGLIMISLGGAAGAQARITEEQAIRAVRAFMGEPSLDVVVEALRDPRTLDPLGEPYYEIRASRYPQARGMYFVRARDGYVSFASFGDTSNSGESTPRISLDEAVRVARDFAVPRYPALNRGRWQLAPERYLRNGPNYNVMWQPVIGAHNVMLPWDVWVLVNGTTGLPAFSTAPSPDQPLLAPLEPRISVVQARGIAVSFGRDPELIAPMREPVLEITVDRVGVQRLVWRFRHYRGEDPNAAPYEDYISVDATTGAFLSRSVRLGTQAGSPGAKAPEPPPDPRRPKLARTDVKGGEPQIGCSVSPVITEGRMWVRVEMLRGLGAKVEADLKRATVTVDGRPVPAKVLSPKWRDYGWWTPLRDVARHIGWRVAWRPETLTAVVTVRGGSGGD